MTDFTTAARPYANATYDIASEAAKKDKAAFESWSDALADLAAVAQTSPVEAPVEQHEQSR